MTLVYSNFPRRSHRQPCQIKAKEISTRFGGKIDIRHPMAGDCPAVSLGFPTIRPSSLTLGGIVSSEAFQDRANALEEAFFFAKNKELMAKMQRESQVKERKAALAAASGITNDHVLNDLLAAGVGSETFAAVSLVPLVAVAWADHQMEPAEREAVLKEAAKAGITAGSASYQMLEQWLQQEPGLPLLTAWKEYVASLRGSLDPAARQRLKDEVVGRARHVAKAAGGLLGIATISSSEQQLLSELEKAFG